MADTLFFKRSQTMYPYHINMPPTVPRYPASQDMFRREEPDKYTQRTGRAGYQNWTDKWYDWGHPVRRQEELPQVADRHEPLSRPWQYGVHCGKVSEPKWTKEGKDWPINNQKYLRGIEEDMKRGGYSWDRLQALTQDREGWRSGIPNTENHRARGMREMTFRDEKLYPFSNNMTSTYRRPVYSVFGPMQREPVFGLTRQRNRHGHMPFEDYY